MPTVIKTTDRSQPLHALQIAIGSAQAHIVETSYNRGFDVDFWQRLMAGQPRDSYCLDFFLYCEVKAYCWTHGMLTGKDADANRTIMMQNVVKILKELGMPRTGSCKEFWESQKATGRQRDAYFNPLPGDSVLFDWGTGIHHVGRVKEILPNGHIETVEANTPPDATSGNQSDGDGVYVKTRTRSHVAGFVHFA